MSSTHSNLYCHIVFSTKMREPWLVPDWGPDVHAYMGGIIRSLNAIPITIGGVADHVHILARLRPIHTIAGFVREVKRGSSAWLHDHFRRSAFGWQDGYGAFSVSHRDVPSVQKYISTQKEHHRTISFQDEYRELLRHEGVDFDERYLW